MSRTKPQSPSDLLPLVEAALFATAEPVSLADLADMLGVSQRVTRQALETLTAEYAARPDGALEIGMVDGFILQVKPLFQRIVDRFLPTDLPQATLRTLSYIASRAPLMQRDLVEARGSSAYEHVKVLVERKLVDKLPKGNSFELHLGDRFAEYFRIDRDQIAPTLNRMRS